MQKTKKNRKGFSNFYKNIIIMFRGTVIAQIIAVLSSVYFAKLYGEEAYGILGFFISITSIISIISTLQLEKCIITSKNQKESTNWFNFLLFVIPITIFVSSCLLYFLSLYIYLEKLTSEIFLIIISGSLIISYILIFESSLTFQKKFKKLSNAKIVITSCNVIFQFLFFSYFKFLGLILGFIVSRFLILIYFFTTENTALNINFNRIKKGIRLNSSILKFLLPSNILNGLAHNLMPLLIIYFFSMKEAGVYFFSMKILGTPLFLISSSMSQVFFQKSSKLYFNDKKELLLLTLKMVKSNLLIMLFLLIGINTIGIYLLETYFNTSWNNLRLYTLILSLLILARSSFNPISSLVVVLDKNHVSLYFNIYLLFVNLIAIYFGHLYSDIIFTIYILSFLGALGYLALLLYFIKHLKSISITNV